MEFSGREALRKRYLNCGVYDGVWSVVSVGGRLVSLYKLSVAPDADDVAIMGPSVRQRQSVVVTTNQQGVLSQECDDVGGSK